MWFVEDTWPHMDTNEYVAELKLVLTPLKSGELIEAKSGRYHGGTWPAPLKLIGMNDTTIAASPLDIPVMPADEEIAKLKAEVAALRAMIFTSGDRSNNYERTKI